MNILKLIIYILVSIVMVIVINWINSFNMKKHIKIIFTVISIGVYATFQVIWIQNSFLKAEADSGFVYGTAKLLFNHQDIMKEHILKYFSYYKQNIGLVIIYRVLMQIFHTDNINLFRYFNVVCNVVTVLGLYWIYIMLEKNNKPNGWLFYVLILGFLPISLLSTWVYGDFIGLSLGILSIACMIKYIKDKKVQFFIFSSLSMALSIIARGNSLIFIIAITMYLLFTIKEEKTTKEKIIRLLMIFLFIIISVAPNKILTGYISNKYQLNDKKEKSVITYLYMGVSEGKLANGWYNDEINEINTEMKEHEKEDKTIENKTKEKLKERVKYLLKNPGYTYWFYKYKVLSMWAEPTMGSKVYNTQIDADMAENKIFVAIFEGHKFEVLKSSQKIIIYIIFAGSLICVIMNKKEISNEMILLILVFLGGFSFHILWEAKARYIIPYVVILIPLSVIGINELIRKIKERKDRKNEKNISSDTNVLRGRSSRRMLQ